MTATSDLPAEGRAREMGWQLNTLVQVFHPRDLEGKAKNQLYKVSCGTQTHTHIPHHTDRLMFFDGSAIKKNVLLLQRPRIQLPVSTSGSSQPFAVLAPGDLMSPSGLCRHYTNTHTPHTSTHTEPIRPGLQLRRHTEGAVCLPGMHKAPGFHLRHRIHSRDCSLYETEHF